MDHLLFRGRWCYIASMIRPILSPSDLLSITFLALLSGLSIFSAPGNSFWAGLVPTYAVLSGVILVTAFYRASSGSTKAGFHLSIIVMVITVLITFNSLGTLITFLHDTTIDASLIRIDQAIFGVHPTVWLERLFTPLLTDMLQLAYVSYYFIPLALGIILINRGRTAEFEEVLFGILLCFYLSYVGYLLFPAIGPRFTLSHLQTTDLQGSTLMAAIQDGLNALEKNKTDAFPSGHTAISLLCLYYAWKEREKVLFATLFPLVTGLVVSTVYLRYHYVIDVIAGAGLTGLTIMLAPVLRRALSGRRWQQTPRRPLGPDRK